MTQDSNARLARLLADLEHAGKDSDEITRLLHELHAHQIELEQQNRELLAVREVLEASRERYADLYDFAPVGYLSLDAAGAIRDINLTGAKLLGQSRDRLLGRAFRVFLVRDDRRRMQAHLADALRLQERLSCELRLQSDASTASAEPRTLMLDSQVEAGTTPARIRVILSDITERKQTERERREHDLAAAAAASRNRLLSGLERLSAAATAAFDPETVFNDLLRVVQDLLRVDRAWLLYPCDPEATEVRILAEAAVPGCPSDPPTNHGIPLDDSLRALLRSALNTPDPLPDPDPSVAPALGGGFAPRSRMVVAVRPKGDRPLLMGLHLCRAERTWGEDDRTLARALAGRLADILDVLAVRRDLTESEERFRATFEQAAVGICQLDTQGRFLRVNRKLCDTLGYRQAELLVRTCRGLAHPMDRDDLMHYIAAIDAGGCSNPGKSLELRYLDKQGRALWCNLTMSAVRDPNGCLRYYIAVLEDISPRKTLEERESRHRDALFRVGRISTMGEMSSAIAHEVAQPLMAISNYAGAALERIGSAPAEIAPVRGALLEISRLAQRAGLIIARIRDFSRQHASAPRPIDLNAVSQAAVDMIASELRAHDTRVEVQIDADAPCPYGGPVEIEQVLINLLINGMEAMRDTPTPDRLLQLGVQRTAHHKVRVAVGDRGIGLDGTDRNRLFDPFYTTKEGGTGIGLSVSRTIVESYGGRIWAESRPGGGTVLAFTLPVGRPDQLPASPPDDSSPSARPIGGTTDDGPVERIGGSQ